MAAKFGCTVDPLAMVVGGAPALGLIGGHQIANKINVIIENHGGISSNPDVVVRLMKAGKPAAVRDIA
ncbi:MAG: hypothetical protein JJE04_20595 [Acidobacteriia bacterium]|nr:hypothetical protein [Terriglobia bacterium]